MADRVNQAVEYFNKGYNCSQAIAAVYGPEFGMDESSALKVSAGFGGGMGRMGEVCGALSGVFMMLSLRYGTDDPEDKETKINVYALVVNAAERFRNQNNTVYCKDLLGFEMLTEEGQQAAQCKSAFERCPDYVKSAAEILEQILGEN